MPNDIVTEGTMTSGGSVSSAGTVTSTPTPMNSGTMSAVEAQPSYSSSGTVETTGILDAPYAADITAGMAVASESTKVGDLCINADGIAGTWHTTPDGWVCVAAPVSTMHGGNPVVLVDPAAAKASSDFDIKAMMLAAEAAGAKAARALIPELVKAAEDAAKAAAIAAVESALKDITLPDSFPPMVTSAWDQAKLWIRKEIALAQAGHSEETRAAVNS